MHPLLMIIRLLGLLNNFIGYPHFNSYSRSTSGSVRLSSIVSDIDIRKIYSRYSSFGHKTSGEASIDIRIPHDLWTLRSESHPHRSSSMKPTPVLPRIIISPLRFRSHIYWFAKSYFIGWYYHWFLSRNLSLSPTS